jgi:hypothetical protein
MIKELNLWSTPVTVIDQFVSDSALMDALRSESMIADTVQGQNTHNLTSAQKQLLHMVSAIVVDYCEKNKIDYNNLKLCNLQKGYLYRYDQQSVGKHLYEPHHDMVEQSFITALFYVNSDYDGINWCGGELTLYKELTFADYPNNTINILPKPNRLIIFPGFTVHRVKPYFGKHPRTSLVFGWSVIDGPDVPSMVI